MQALSDRAAPPLEKWEFGVEFGPRWDVSADSRDFTDEDRRQWRNRLPVYVVADHLTAESSFRAMIERVRVAAPRDPVALLEARCFSPRGGDKGGRRAVMARLLKVAASAEPGEEEQALQRLVAGAWSSGENQVVRRAVTQLQERYIARLWTGARVLACRAGDRCVECDIASSVEMRTYSGDYCRAHAVHVDYKQLVPNERERRRALRQSKTRYRKATEHLFLELAAVLPPEQG